MAEMGFTRGRIDQTYQGSVSIYMNHPLIRNLVLTTNPMFFFFLKKTSYEAGINTFDTSNVR